MPEPRSPPGRRGPGTPTTLRRPKPRSPRARGQIFATRDRDPGRSARRPRRGPAAPRSDPLRNPSSRSPPRPPARLGQGAPLGRGFGSVFRPQFGSPARESSSLRSCSRIIPATKSSLLISWRCFASALVILSSSSSIASLVQLSRALRTASLRLIPWPQPPARAAR
jgi:hypothetical protein